MDCSAQVARLDRVPSFLQVEWLSRGHARSNEIETACYATLTQLPLHHRGGAKAAHTIREF